MNGSPVTQQLAALDIKGYRVAEVLYESRTVVFGRALSPGRPSLLIGFLRDARLPASPCHVCKMVFLPGPHRPRYDRILPLVAVGRAGPWTIVAYPCVRALPLFTRMERMGVETHRQAVDYGVEVAKALGALHQHSLVSAEVSPATVFVTVDDDRRVFLAFNRTIGRIPYAKLLSVHPFFRRHALLPTPQAREDTPTMKTDVYLVAALIMTLATGERRVADTFLHTLPRFLASFAYKALSLRASERHRTMDEVVTHLTSSTSSLRLALDVRELLTTGRAAAKPPTCNEAPLPPRVGETLPSASRWSKCLVGLGSQRHGLCLCVLALVLVATLYLRWPRPATTTAGLVQAQSQLPRQGGGQRSCGKGRRGACLSRLGKTVERLRRAPTTISSFSRHVAFLRQCHRRLPDEWRDEAIAMDVLRRANALGRTSPRRACRLVDTILDNLEASLARRRSA